MYDDADVDGNNADDGDAADDDLVVRLTMSSAIVMAM